MKCMICNREFKGIKPSHLSTHGITMAEYKETFPGCPIISDEELKQLTERNKSPKMRELISNRNKDPEFIEKCKAGITEELRRTRAQQITETSKRNWENPECRARMIEGIRKAQYKISKHPDVKKRKSDKWKELWATNPEFRQKCLEAPKKHPFGVQCRYYSDKFSQEYYCRSQGELDFIKLCETLNYVTMVYPGSVVGIKYIVNDQKHVYIPDFLVETLDQNYLVEIKYEDDLPENHKYKINAAVDYCNQNNLKFCYVNRFSGINKIQNLGFESVVISSAL